ncbi:hypothetical protein SEPCBS119000_000507 [Sporothrix epigloea]|uniref:DUF3835 domain-containing protein n=1 Tax=Sporothrix epigloea TaxID=1892477 RepID=A0ABP0D761_9PEZI
MSQPPVQTSAPSQVRDLLANLQHQTAQFDAQVAQLSGTLDHWRLLGAEYEALAEEIKQARAKGQDTGVVAQQAEQDALVRIRRDFDGQLVDQETVCDLFGARVGQTITRSTEHIASAIGRRLDYVNQNIQAMEKRVKAVMDKLSALEAGGLTALLDGNSGVDQKGDPVKGYESGDAEGTVTDIVERLDDDDNVVDVQLHTPSQTQMHVLAALEKAGISELPAAGPLGEEMSAESAPEESGTLQREEKESTMTNDTRPTANLKPNTKSRSKGAATKSVSFADDGKISNYDEPPSSSSSKPQSFAAQRLENIIQSAKQQESAADASSYIYPEGEAEDDAALRREMLEYSRSEIGPIVAQLDIEEDLSDIDEGYDDDFYDDEFDEDEENEDENGRSRYSVIDDAYRERMRELERALGVQSLDTVSALPAAPVPNDIAESLGRIRVSGNGAALIPSDAKSADDQESTTATTLTSALREPTENFKTRVTKSDIGNKKVSFAQFVDVAPQSTESAPGLSVLAAEATPATAKPVVNPLCDVVERSDSSKGSAAPAPDAAAKPKGVSRFKKARLDGTGPDLQGLPRGPHQAPVRFLDQDHTVIPEGPAGKTHAEEVIERQSVTEPKEPHELDAGILMQEATTQYHRTRNRMIQQQGGFLKASETAVVPVGQEDGGRRISKFKAARLGNQFMTPQTGGSA